MQNTTGKEQEAEKFNAEIQIGFISETGSLIEGEHPDEIYPRAGSWLQERRNWQSQVALLEKEIEKLKTALSHPTTTVLEEKEDEMLTWFVIAYGALEELVKLKNIKETEGKTEEYLERQPMAWYAANQVIELWKKSDYGAMDITKGCVLVKAEFILKMRDALVQDDFNEVYHFLYQIASPHFDKMSDDVWKELETKAAQYQPSTVLGWVDVKDRLPEIPPPYYHKDWEGTATPLSINVIVYDAVEDYCFECTYTKLTGFFDKDITHWMYFPEPPIK